MQELLLTLGEAGLFVYAVLKAFLPLPSLEVLLIPMVIADMPHAFLYALLGGVGTIIGASIGYWIARRLGKRVLARLADETDLEEGSRLINQYGVLAVFIGGVTPLPDFLLAYLAGICHMNYFLFVITDGLARFLRSLLVIWMIRQLGMVIDIEQWGNVFSLVIVGGLLLRYGWKDKKTASAG